MSWDPSKALVQIELGDDVAQAVTPDTRSRLDEIIGRPRPELSEDVEEAIGHLCNKLKSEGIKVPSAIDLDIDDDIPDNAFIIHIGVDQKTYTLPGTARSSEEDAIRVILEHLESRLRYYGTKVFSEKEIEKSLCEECLLLIKDNKYNDAFRKYQKLYYDARCQDYSYEFARCLCDLGSLFLQNAEFDRAEEILAHAQSFFDIERNIVDINLKTQSLYSYAAALTANEKLDDALEYYIKSEQLAYHAGNYTLMFNALLGIGNVQYYMDELELAAQAYKEAENLLKEKTNNNQEIWQAAYELRRDISDIYEHLYRQSQEDINSKINKSVNSLLTFFTALINSFGPVAAGVICKYFKLPSGGIMLCLFGSMQYNFGDYANNNFFKEGPVQSYFIQR